MSGTNKISQAMTARSNECVIESFSNGNVDLFKKWAPDSSRTRIALAIAKRNLMAAFINRLRHEYESAGLWYLHGIITGYLAKEKPPYVPKDKKQVQYPVLSVDGARDCVSWLEKYASSYATENVRDLSLLF